jgi:hypothetical protein
MTGTIDNPAETPVHGVQAHPGGLLRRMISLDHRGPDTVVGWLEDHYHHFGVSIVHDGVRVLDIRTAAPRHPWATCPGTVVPLRALIGKPLITRASALGALIDMRQQCTHVFDLVALVLVQAATRRPDRVYEAIVTDRSVTTNASATTAAQMHIYGPGTATLYQDGTLAMRWELDDRMIVGPAPYGGHSLGAGFRAWTEGMPEQPAEYATILRRTILVAGGRNQNLDEFQTANEQKMPPVCYAFQPERSAIGYRMANSSRNYEASNASMLSHRAETP